MSSQHTDVGAYSLGLLEPQDKQDFEAHLVECASCTAELAEFSSMADLFIGIEPVETAPDEPAEAAVVDLVRRRAAERHRRVWRQSVLAAAASLVLLAGGVAAGIAAAPQQAAPVAALVGQLHSATDAATGVTGKVGLVAKPWGTSVTLDLANVRGPLECQLVAVSRTGERRIVTGWFVPAVGYGVPGHPAPLIITGGTAIAMKNLASVAVQVVHGGTLLTITI